jgi:iron complex outermembrane recepter protein
MGPIMKKTFPLLLGIGFWLLSALGAVAEQPVTPVSLNIPSQAMEDALNELAQQTGLQLLFQSRVALEQKAPAVIGTLTPQEGLERLLANSGLRYEFINANTVTIRATKGAAAREEEGKNSAAREESSEAVMLAQADAAPSAAGSSENAADPSESSTVEELEEILVTARKREERLQDVPAPVSVLSGQALISSNQTRLQDYFTSVPGLSLVSGLGEVANVSIRGITTGASASNPTVGILIDDVPVGSSTFWGGGHLIPDIDPSDLARIEVLRGPQGTLYGASGLGGLMKFVTVRPMTDRVSGSAELGTSDIRGADDPGYVVRAAINVPLGETFAARASGFSRTDSGYIDNPTLGKEDVNEIRAKGGRLAALWQPTDSFSLALSALQQQTTEVGRAYSTLGLGDLEQSAARGTGEYEKDLKAYSATIEAGVAGIDLTSLTGFSESDLIGNDDVPSFGGKLNNIVSSRRFTQEARVTGSFTPKVDWLIGGFYTHERSRNPQDVQAVPDPLTGVEAGEIVDIDVKTRYREHAAFGSLTFLMSDRFDVQVGGRYSENTQRFNQVWAGPLATIIFAQDPYLPPEARPSGDAFTYLVTPRWRLSPDLMLFARVASGYRAGGANSNGTLGAVPNFAPDTTDNYEVGVRGELFGRAVSFDASIYHIDWRDIQLQVITPANTTAYVNGPSARSQGIELSLDFRPLQSLMLGGWVSWNLAELTQDIPTNPLVFGASGDRLPHSPKFSANISASQTFELAQSVTATLFASASYVGAREGAFTATPARQPMASYTKVDLNAEMRRDAWALNLYINNLTDKRGVVGGGIGTAKDDAITYIRPRTIGIRIAHDF